MPVKISSVMKWNSRSHVLVKSNQYDTVEHDGFAKSFQENTCTREKLCHAFQVPKPISHIPYYEWIPQVIKDFTILLPATASIMLKSIVKYYVSREKITSFKYQVPNLNTNDLMRMLPICRVKMYPLYCLIILSVCQCQNFSWMLQTIGTSGLIPTGVTIM